MTEAYLQMGAALAGVLGLIVLIGRLAGKKQTAPGMLKVLAYQALGPRKGIAAVRAGKQTLLIGVTQNDVKLLGTVEGDFDDPPPEAPDSGIGARLKEFKSMKDRLHAVK